MASRIVADERGQPVIAELRVFPHEPERPPHYPGMWGAEVLGRDVRHAVPWGGLPATLLRRGITLTVHRQSRCRRPELATVLERLPTVPGHPVDPANGVLADIRDGGLTAKARGRLVVDASGKRRGRPEKRTPRDYARIALVYDDALRAGQSPIAAIVASERVTTAIARNIVARARKLGKMPEAAGQGKPLPRLSAELRSQLAREAAADTLTDTLRNGRRQKTRKRTDKKKRNAE